MLIRSTESQGVKNLKMAIYGVSGVGKTSLAATTGEPTLIISAESGLLSIKKNKLDYLDVARDDEDNQILGADKKLERLQAIAAYVNTKENKEKYKWLFIDSLTEIGQVILESLKITEPKFQDPRNSLQMWGAFGEKMRGMIKFFRDMSGYNVVFTALAKQEKDELGRRYMGIDLQGKTADQLPGYFDEVFYFDIFESEDKTKIRQLATQPSDKYVAKDRSGVLSQYEQPNLANIARKIREGTK